MSYSKKSVLLSAVFGGVTLLMGAQSAIAQPLFAGLYKQQYGYAPSCNACHRDGGGSPLNNFGKSFKDGGESAATFDKIANLDSDGDGAKNGDEAAQKSNPGDPQSTPAKKGQWLDITSLIPKEVQKLFPDTREYLPRDALLTDADIARAKTMGAVLSKKDDNTIYIPLKDAKPAGTALIFQAEFKGKPFFLLMGTDRQLKITKVEPVNTRQVPDAAKSKAYDKFVGQSVDQLPAASGSDLDAAIAAAVKKAGTLLFVRLKSA